MLKTWQPPLNCANNPRSGVKWMELEKFVHCCYVFCESIGVQRLELAKPGAVCSAEGLSMNSGPGRDLAEPPSSQLGDNNM